jgi:hypothetical protein
MRKIVNYIAVVLILLAMACKEDIKITPATISDTLTGGSVKTWKLDSITYRYTNTSLGEVESTLSFLYEYEADNLLTFYKDGLKFEESEGATKDAEGDPSITSAGEFVLNIPSTSLSFMADESTYTVFYALYGALSSVNTVEVLEDDRIVYRVNGAAFAGFFGGSGDVVYYLSPAGD